MELSINLTKTNNFKIQELENNNLENTESEPQNDDVIDEELNEKLKEELLVKLLNLMKIECNNIKEALGTIIEQTQLKNFELDKTCFCYVNELKKFYKSNMLNCLHKNSLSKQKYPAVNMLRQILKCNNIKLKPFNICNGYNKSTGNKIVKRFYKIITMEDYQKEKEEEEIELKKSIEKKKQLAALNKTNNKKDIDIIY